MVTVCACESARARVCTTFETRELRRRRLRPVRGSTVLIIIIKCSPSLSRPTVHTKIYWRAVEVGIGRPLRVILSIVAVRVYPASYS